MSWGLTRVCCLEGKVLAPLIVSHVVATGFHAEMHSTMIRVSLILILILLLAFSYFLALGFGQSGCRQEG